MIEVLLQKHQTQFAQVVSFDWVNEKILHLDLTAQNKALAQIDLSNTQLLNDFIFGEMKKANARVAVGGYLEHRILYQRSPHFQQAEAVRCIHLGIDIWTTAGTPVYAPYEGRLHSFANNDNFGDYGPTLILEHQLENQLFYSLYGHLTLDSLEGKTEGMIIKKGDKIAEIGNFPINGDWPPHLHFQLMTDMMGMKGDFWGTCTEADQTKFSQICPDPKWVLGLS